MGGEGVAGGFPETADIETASDDYASRFAGKTGAWLLRVQEDATAALLRGHEGGRALDVGGGHGQLTPLLVSSGFEVTVTGSDASCGSRIRDYLAHGPVSFEVADVLNLPFEDRAFDVVLSYRLLTHVERWRELLGELARVADRAVIIDFASTRSVNRVSPWLFGAKKRVEGNTRPFRLYREADIVAVLAEHGFDRTGRVGQFFLPMALHRLINAPALSAAAEAPFRWSGLTSVFGSPVILKAERGAMIPG